MAAAGQVSVAVVRTEWVEVPVDGERMAAYLARPDAGEHPVVIVGFEMFGVTGYVRSVAERLADAGFTAVVPDFYHRAGQRIELAADEAGRARGLDLLGGVTRDGVLADVRAVIEQFGPAALLGLSVGGHLVYYASTQVPVRTLVAFYPGWLTGTDIALSRPEPTIELTPGLAEHGTRVLVLTGERDHLVDEAARAAIARALERAGVEHEVVVYPGAPHGFFCDERPSYVETDAADAWERALTALRR